MSYLVYCWWKLAMEFVQWTSVVTMEVFDCCQLETPNHLSMAANFEHEPLSLWSVDEVHSSYAILEIKWKQITLIFFIQNMNLNRFFPYQWWNLEELSYCYCCWCCCCYCCYLCWNFLSGLMMNHRCLHSCYPLASFYESTDGKNLEKCQISERNFEKKKENQILNTKT